MYRIFRTARSRVPPKIRFYHISLRDACEIRESVQNISAGEPHCSHYAFALTALSAVPFGVWRPVDACETAAPQNAERSAADKSFLLCSFSFAPERKERNSSVARERAIPQLLRDSSLCKREPFAHSAKNDVRAKNARCAEQRRAGKTRRFLSRKEKYVVRARGAQKKQRPTWGRCFFALYGFLRIYCCCDEIIPA